MHKFTIDTQLYAGTIAHGYKDRLFQFCISEDHKKLEIKYAFADIEPKSRGQKNVVMEANCNIDFAIKIDHKKKIEIIGGAIIAEIMENVTTISGNTFELKDWIKDFGFTWNPIEKNWIK